MKRKLEEILRGVLESCFEQGALARTEVPDFVVEVPNNPEHGHFATNLALTLAASQKRPPREIAGVIAEWIQGYEDLIESVDIAGPGFLNFVIRLREWHRALCEAVSLGPDYGRSTMGRGKKILVEFVSANPTGPLHLGHGRGAALGDSLCRILAFSGHDVEREFYINDAGAQVRLLGESIYARWRRRRDTEYPFPEKGYRGPYIDDLASEMEPETAHLEGLEVEEAVERCADFGRARMLEEIKRDLEEFRTGFDTWFSERDLVASGALNEALEGAKERGELYERDGAWWIQTTAYGDDKDRVIRKNDGEFTYFATDIAYHLNKWGRGFTGAVNIWGADHHGYVKRVKAALAAAGLAPDWLSVLLIQLVKLWQGGEEVRMSKRAGNYVTLKELIEEVGVDSARFIFLIKNHDSPLDFDLDLAKRRDSDNPVYYVQYAHARICSVFRKAAEAGVDFPDNTLEAVKGLRLEEEAGLIRLLTRFPDLVEEVSRNFEPHRLTYYLTDLAAAFHKYFNLGTKMPECRILAEDVHLSKARLCLAAGIREVLRTGLWLLGVDAPEKM